MSICGLVCWWGSHRYTPPRAHTRTHSLSKYKESCIRHQLLLALWSHPILRHLANLSSKTQGKTKGSRFVSSLFPFFCFCSYFVALRGNSVQFQGRRKKSASEQLSTCLAFTVRIKLAVKIKIFLISCSVTGIQMLLLHWNWCFSPVRHTCPVSTTVSRVNSRNRSMHNCTM